MAQPEGAGGAVPADGAADAGEAGILVSHLRKTFRGGIVACDDVTLALPDGELLVLLGPSGCGKTTTLRCIGGLERPDNDDAIWIRGRNLTRVAPKDRNLAFMFQGDALFPHLSVRRNISFGLDMKRRLSREEIAARVEEVAGLLRIGDLLERSPRELSGGQGQRVALGRAIVMEPDAFLLDEPFAALDAALRVDMRTEIKLIQRRLGATMIFVTHDQQEALTLGDKIAVMNAGRVQQIGTPDEIYNQPANLFVARFIGSPQINLLQGRIAGSDGAPVFQTEAFVIPLPADSAAQVATQLAIRPENLRLDPPEPLARGRVRLVELLGSQTMVLVESAGLELRVLVQGRPGVGEGAEVGIGLGPAAPLLFDANGGRVDAQL